MVYFVLPRRDRVLMRAMSEPTEDRYLIVSTDGHAGLLPEKYGDYIDPKYRMAFEGSVAAEVAKRAADALSTEERPRWVAGALGPTNKTCSISPDVNDPGFRNISFEELVDQIDLSLITKATFFQIHDRLKLFDKALRIEGIHSVELERQLEMLSHSLEARGFTFTQYIDIFKGFTQAVKNIINDYFANVHGQNLTVVAIDIAGDGRLIALDAQTGKRCPGFGEAGEIELTADPPEQPASTAACRCSTTPSSTNTIKTSSDLSSKTAGGAGILARPGLILSRDRWGAGRAAP